jgi:hypothetical protein
MNPSEMGFKNVQYVELTRVSLLSECDENSVSVTTGNFSFNLLKPTGYAMHQQCTNSRMFDLSTLYLCVVYLPENKQRLVPLPS